MIATTIEELLNERFKQADLADCYVVEVKELPGKRYEVYLDSDEGISFEKCKRVSRFLEEFLDNDQRTNGKYILDVSSAGVGRPLKLKRQFTKNIGRTLKVKIEDGNSIEGELKTVDDEKIILEVQRKKERIKNEILFNQIKEAKIKVRF